MADRWVSERFQCFLYVSDWHYPPTLLGKLVHCPNDDGTGFLGADGVGDRAQRRLQPGSRYVDERLDLGLELLEQPVPKWDPAGMAQVRAAVDVLIEADEAAYRVRPRFGQG